MPYILIWLLALFLAVILTRAALFVPPKAQPERAEDIPLDVDQLAGNLQQMLQIPTVSDVDERLVDQQPFASFRQLLRTLYPKVFERFQYEEIGRNGILLKLPGKRSDSPSVLMAHYDVVPAQAEAWTHPPFAGVIQGGELWGRGALDTKVTVLCLFEAAEALLKQGFVPEQDLYLSLGGDEECLGQDASAIVDELERRGVKPGFVLDEGGAIVSRVFPGVQEPAALIGIAEKGSVFVDLVATGRSGHASAPPARQVVGTLTRVLTRVGKRPMPFTLTRPALELFDAMGRHSTFLYKIIFANLWCFAPLLDLICRKAGGELNALVRTTVAQTKLSASDSYNVLPAEARAGLNLRLISGDSAEKAIERLSKIINDQRVQVSLNRGSEPSPISPTRGAAWERLTTAIRQTYPEALISPYLMVAASDSRHFCRISGQVYRFSGLPMTRDQLALIHSHDERIPLALLPDALRFYLRVMAQC